MLVVIGELSLAPEHLRALRSEIAELIGESRRDPGCLAYNWEEDMVEPGILRIVEYWATLDDFKKHDRSAHATKWKDALARYGLLGRRMTAHETAEMEEI
jgi:quinol monooxygenase YgiN